MQRKVVSGMFTLFTFRKILASSTWKKTKLVTIFEKSYLVFNIFIDRKLHTGWMWTASVIFTLK